MNPAALLPQQPVQPLNARVVTLSEVVQILQSNPDIHPQVNSEVLPGNYDEIGSVLSRSCNSLCKYSNELGFTAASNHMTLNARKIKRIRESFLGLETVFMLLVRFLKRLLVIMDLLKTTSSLREENQARFEDLERLTASGRIDMIRIKARLGELH